MLAYVAPMLAFLLVLQLEDYAPADFAWLLYLLRVVAPAGALAYFWSQGCYRELRLKWSWMFLSDLLVGVALAAMWILPYVLFPQLRPSGADVEFDPTMFGVAWVSWVLALRMIGYAMVTPVMEELFMRSFLMRYADVYDGDQDFRKLPLARFTWRSFIVVVVVFMGTHMMWEWWVMLPWAVLTNLWFYYRKDLFAIIVVHAATNASILLAAIFASDSFSLWFLV
ncbi:CAAX prenyl protease-related protein [Neorhodopirellula lusitana]|uniref:CAAX prenyl protease-related protein n=1 Tax=Neorhodopirellula lusitana TaxID=445327 RepID=UPI0038506048